MFGLSIDAQAAANSGSAKRRAVGQDVDLRLGMEVAAEAQQLDQILPVERRLAAGEPDLRGVARKQPDQLEGLCEQVIVDRGLRRLRAHQAVVVAALGEQDAVLAAAVAPEDADRTPSSLTATTSSPLRGSRAPAGSRTDVRRRPSGLVRRCEADTGRSLRGLVLASATKARAGCAAGVSVRRRRAARRPAEAGLGERRARRLSAQRDQWLAQVRKRARVSRSPS